MKNRNLLLISLIFLMAKLPAQAPFFKFVSGWRNNIIQELPQNYISCGSETQDYRHLVHTEGFSLSGDSLYSHSFGVDTASYTYATYTNSVLKIGPTNYTAINFKPENDPYLHGLLLKFNEDFSDTIATKLYTNDGIDSRRLLIIEQKNDTTLMLGSQIIRGQWKYSSFMETDTLGQIRWQKDYYADGQLSPFHILPTVDKGYIFTCFNSIYNGEDNVNQQTEIIKTDSLGNVQWRHYWGGDTTRNIGSWVVPLDDGNYLYAWTDSQYPDYMAGYKDDATVRFAKFDIHGNIIWYKDLLNTLPITGDDETATQAYTYTITQMEMMPDGNIILAGDNQNEGLLIKIDQEAQYIWHRELLPPGVTLEDNTATAQHMKILGLTFTSDNGFILAGEYISTSSNIFPEGIQSAYAYKLDENGCYEPGCHIHDNIDVVESHEDIGFTLQPNPANSFVVIESSYFDRISNRKVESLAIYDVTGKLVKTISLIEGSESQTIDVSDLDSGIYLVKIGEQAEKLVVQ